MDKGIIKWKEFKIGDLFEKIETKKLDYKATDIKEKHDDFVLPALTAGIENQGLSCYVPKEKATILKNVISVSANGANTGAMFYQPNEFTVLQDSYAIKYKYKELTENSYLFMVATMQKVIKGNFDWSNKAGWNKIKELTIKLPIIETEEIDFEFMEKYIRAMEKLAIADVVKYKDRVIAETKKIVNQ